MGKLEEASRKRTKRDNLRRLILATVQISGLITLAFVAPNVIGGMAKIGLVPSRQQNAVIRRSANRLVQQGLLVWEGKKLRLTQKGERALRVLELKEFGMSKPRRWDGKWRVLIFDIPERRSNLRRRLRDTLRTIGFVQLQGSVWVYPYDCEDLITLLKADFKVGKDVLYMVVDALENDGQLLKVFGLKRRG